MNAAAYKAKQLYQNSIIVNIYSTEEFTAKVNFTY